MGAGQPQSSGLALSAKCSPDHGECGEMCFPSVLFVKSFKLLPTATKISFDLIPRKKIVFILFGIFAIIILVDF